MLSDAITLDDPKSLGNIDAQPQQHAVVVADAQCDANAERDGQRDAKYDPVTLWNANSKRHGHTKLDAERVSDADAHAQLDTKQLADADAQRVADAVTLTHAFGHWVSILYRDTQSHRHPELHGHS